MSNNFETIVDFGSKNLKLGVFDKSLKSIYFSKVEIDEIKENEDSDYALNKLIRSAEKNLSTHLVDVNILYDTSRYNFLELSIKKNFDQPTTFKKQYHSLLEEANFIISENNYKDQIMHVIVNNIIVDNNKNLNFSNEDTKIESLILEIKFICLSKSLIKDIYNKFKKNNLNILNMYCSSYVKSIYYNKKHQSLNNILFLDIGYERTSAIFYKDKKFQFFNCVPLGGNSITKDISKVLKLNINYSEKLKIKFNTKENENSFKQETNDMTNIYSEILKNNISVDLLKQVIDARVDEIVELSTIQNNYLKKIYDSEQPVIIFTGNGSKMLSNNNNLKSKVNFHKLIFSKENDSMICDAGIYYHRSDERLLMQKRKKSKKTGFFENFFNLFS